MANPKRRHSKARTATRRAQYKVRSLPVTQECSNCGSDKILHRACPNCGHYRGRAVVERTERY
ncbi:50S ribosomal protein L32 [Rubricoccus marinus]|uniref:Large ribosomal subunit protein bL32 n=1 Tax=Rubricoccus marinus TaxID=716817 RepID=A0A259U2I9_9BACT|nr:50S ribosomal protein L32 [Rubricoccus marinus]OZC04209.1 50S ribosomal protein L32 [Rubricoccus marinus]